MCIPATTNSTEFGSDATTKVLTSIVASLSIVGSLLIILTFALWKDMRTTSRQILVIISVADLLSSAGNLLGAVVPSHRIMGADICSEQSLVTTMFCLSFILWTTILAVYLHSSIVRGNVQPSYTAKYFAAVIGWGIPFFVTTFAFLLNILGDDNSAASAGWCWIHRYPKFPQEASCTDARLMWSLLTGKGWEIPSYIIVPFYYFLVKRHISQERRSMSQTLVTAQSLQAAVKVNRKLTFVPLAYLLLRIWGSIRYVFEVTDLSQRIYPNHEWLYWTLLYMQALGDNGQGFANFLLFCIFTKTVRKKIARFFALWLDSRTADKERLPLRSAEVPFYRTPKSRTPPPQPKPSGRMTPEDSGFVNFDPQMSTISETES